MYLFWTVLFLFGTMLAIYFEKKGNVKLRTVSLALPLSSLSALFIYNWVIGIIVVLVIGTALYKALYD